MNDFTMQELEYMYDCLDIDFFRSNCPVLMYDPLMKKIQSRIDNYCECNSTECVDRDATPLQCDCYTRGQDHEFKSMIVAIEDILEGKDTGCGCNHEPWGKIRRKLLELVRKKNE